MNGALGLAVFLCGCPRLPRSPHPAGPLPWPPCSPMCRLGRRFSRQGSSLPEGARMLAVSRLRSLSVIFSDTSVEVPTFSCDVLIESSPGGELACQAV